VSETALFKKLFFWVGRVNGADTLLTDRPANRRLAYRLGRLHGRVTAELNDRYGDQPGPDMPVELSLVNHEYEQGRADGIEAYNEEHGY
jgi:hypothetical protein